MKFKKIVLIGAIALMIAGPFLSYTVTFQGVTLIDDDFTSFDGTKITGTVVLPEGHQPTDSAPLIVLMHGFTVSKEFFYPLAAELARHGYICYCFNARGHQTSGNESTLAYHEIEDFRTAITYMLSKNATYGINDTQVGIIGHSHGAICATIVGAKDPRVNATIPISTGANISDIAAKFAGISVSSVFNMLSPLMNIHVNLSDPAELYNRSPIVYVNQNYSSNLLLINGDLDEAFSIQENKEILAKAIWNDTGRADDVIPGKIYTNSSGKRKLVVEHNVEHAMECFMPETFNETVAWMDLTFYGGLREPVNTMTTLVMVSGIMLTLLGGLLGFFVLTSYLAGWTSKKVEKRSTTIQNITLKQKGIQFAMYFALFAGISALIPLIIFKIPGLHSWIPIMFTDLLSLFFIFIALLSVPVLLFLLWYEKRQFSTTIIDFGFNPPGAIYGILIGIIGGFFLVGITSLAVSDFALKLVPASFGNFLIVLITFLPYAFVMELWGRGLIQRKLTNLGKYTEVLVSAAIVGILQGIGSYVLFFVTQQIVGFPSSITLNENLPVINLPLIGLIVFTTLNFGISLLAGYVFQKTRCILSSTIVVTILLSWFLTAWPPRLF
ncbi:MAG: alpha/beta fold hydrolase [Candidatus Helarchaeota archaeon]|nr:alpha/beta fold hydrolase [Candidatus Helarchaeota archaeon]